jgi:uncharacterized protein YdaU (DUF1376 family)
VGGCLVSKTPSFTVHSYPWYISDWRESETRIEMNLEQRGLYRELLDYCYREGTLPDDPRKLAIIAGCTEQEFERAWPAVSDKFTRTDDHRLQHHRVNQILPELERWHEQRRKAGQVSGLSRRKKKANSTEQPLSSRPTVVEREHEPSPSTSTPSSSSTPPATSASAPAEHARSAGVQEPAAVNGKAPLLSKSDDDDPNPKTYANAAEELKARYLAHVGEAITIAVLDSIRSDLGGEITPAFVAELRKHNGKFTNYPGFIRDLAEKFRSKMAKAAAAPVQSYVLQPEEKCKIEGCGQKPGEGLVLRDGQFIPCPCATPLFVQQHAAKEAERAKKRESAA